MYDRWDMGHALMPMLCRQGMAHTMLPPLIIAALVPCHCMHDQGQGEWAVSSPKNYSHKPVNTPQRGLREEVRGVMSTTSIWHDMKNRSNHTMIMIDYSIKDGVSHRMYDTIP